MPIAYGAKHNSFEDLVIDALPYPLAQYAIAPVESAKAGIQSAADLVVFLEPLTIPTTRTRAPITTTLIVIFAHPGIERRLATSGILSVIRSG